MLKQLSTLAVSLTLAASVTVTAIDTAEAGRRHRGAMIGGAALGLFVLGSMAGRADNYRERCYRGPRECRWMRGACYRDRFGDYECEDGHEECHRPLYCE